MSGTWWRWPVLHTGDVTHAFWPDIKQIHTLPWSSSKTDNFHKKVEKIPSTKVIVISTVVTEMSLSYLMQKSTCECSQTHSPPSCKCPLTNFSCICPAIIPQTHPFLFSLVKSSAVPHQTSSITPERLKFARWRLPTEWWTLRLRSLPSFCRSHTDQADCVYKYFLVSWPRQRGLVKMAFIGPIKWQADQSQNTSSTNSC